MMRSCARWFVFVMILSLKVTFLQALDIKGRTENETAYVRMAQINMKILALEEEISENEARIDELSGDLKPLERLDFISRIFQRKSRSELHELIKENEELKRKKEELKELREALYREYTKYRKDRLLEILSEKEWRAAEKQVRYWEDRRKKARTVKEMMAAEKSLWKAKENLNKARERYYYYTRKYHNKRIRNR